MTGSVRLSVRPSVRLCLSLSLSVCLSVCLSVVWIINSKSYEGILRKVCGGLGIAQGGSG